jgi:hypothetical protein
MRIFLILLRIGVLFIAFIGAGLSGLGGYIWWDDVGQPQKKADMANARKKMAAAEMLVKTLPPGDKQRQRFETEQKNVAKLLEEVDRRQRAWPFLMAGAVLALLGGFFALFGRTTSGAMLMFLAAFGPIWLTQPKSFSAPLVDLIVDDWKPVLFCAPLVLAGFCSLFVSFLAWVTRPKPGAEQPPPRGEEDEEEPGTRKAKAKRKDDLEEEEEPVAAASKGGGKRKDDRDEDEEPEPPAKAAPKRESDFEDEEEEPPPRPSAKRKRD